MIIPIVEGISNTQPGPFSSELFSELWSIPTNQQIIVEAISQILKGLNSGM